MSIIPYRKGAQSAKKDSSYDCLLETVCLVQLLILDRFQMKEGLM